MIHSILILFIITLIKLIKTAILFLNNIHTILWKEILASQTALSKPLAVQFKNILFYLIKKNKKINTIINLFK